MKLEEYGAGSGLKVIEVPAAVALVQPRRQLPQDRHELLPGLGRHGPDDVGHVLVPLRPATSPMPGRSSSVMCLRYR